jgi:hypothetical protein
MRMMSAVAILAVALVAFLISVAPGIAVPTGFLNLTNGLGGGALFTATSVDWVPPVGQPNGSLATGLGTNVTFTGGPLGPAVLGSVLDLSFATPSLSGFMTFTGFPALAFDLSSVGPGMANTNCAGLSLGQSCSPSSGSPYLLTATSVGTTLTLSVGGVARDVLDGNSTWSGEFTSQFGLTPAQLQSSLLGGGALANTYSGSFTASSVPEPSSWLLLVAGVGAAGARHWVRARRSA